MKDIITHIVSMRNGIRSVDLCLAVMEKVNPQRFDYDKYLNCIIALIREDEIRVLDYTDPNDVMTDSKGKKHNATKNMYFSKGTTFLNLKGLVETNERASENTLVRKS